MIRLSRTGEIKSAWTVSPSKRVALFLGFLVKIISLSNGIIISTKFLYYTTAVEQGFLNAKKKSAVAAQAVGLAMGQKLRTMNQAFLVHH